MLPATATWKIARTYNARRLLHVTSRHADIIKFQMPAMSPTMTEGGIADWKKKEGQWFVAGDVLLEIETDKATIDVEAQDDGIVGKILAPNGTKNIRVGTTIALLAQEGDDISNLEVPAEEPSAAISLASSPPAREAPPPSPTISQPVDHSAREILHDRPMFPSVTRLLQENGTLDVRHIKGTGIRGMLTKGDVLAYLGKASGPYGTFKDNTPTPSLYKSQAVIARTQPASMPLDAPGIRRTILAALLARSTKSRKPSSLSAPPTADSVIAEYLPPTPPSTLDVSSPPLPKITRPEYLDGLY